MMTSLPKSHCGNFQGDQRATKPRPCYPLSSYRNPQSQRGNKLTDYNGCFAYVDRDEQKQHSATLSTVSMSQQQLPEAIDTWAFDPSRQHSCTDQNQIHKPIKPQMKADYRTLPWAPKLCIGSQGFNISPFAALDRVAPCRLNLTLWASVQLSLLCTAFHPVKAPPSSLLTGYLDCARPFHKLISGSWVGIEAHI